ncbi:MAG: inner-membrane translocator [Ktedonobacterales bacterium]
MSSDVVNPQTPPVGQKTLPAPQPPATPSLPTTPGGLLSLFRGDLGQVPVFLTLVVIAIYFQVTTSGLFLSPRNISNLLLQIATIAMLAVASVFVLLLGEIDLSLAAVAYTCGGVMVVLSVRHGWATIPALLAGLLTGAVIGLVNGFFISFLRVPSFIVTLAASIAYSGLVLHILLPNTSIILTDPTLVALATDYLPSWLGIALPVIGVALYVVGLIVSRVNRQRVGLIVPPLWNLILRIALVAVIVIVVVSVLESNLGVPVSTGIVIALILLFWLILRFTAFGRHVYAVGGNAEATRRAGINVVGIRLTIFVLASTLAAVGGILEASRTVSGSASIDQSLLLDAIAAAVIGGVSLFGGRGSVWAVILGSLIIGSLSNGLDLLSQGTDIKFIVEGIVLLIAVTVDALLRRRSAVTGR